jgi:putative acetyltransferase
MVGHIAFSPIKINNQDSKWVGLAPISVDPKHQNNGIGNKLINEGLDRVRMLNYAGVVVLSDMDCFERFGFNNKPNLEIHEEPHKDTYAVSLNAMPPEGKISVHSAFSRRAWGYSLSSTYNYLK